MGSIAIVGVGLVPGAALPDATAARLRAADRVVVSNADGLVSDLLDAEGVAYTPLVELGVARDAPVVLVIDRLTALAESECVVFATAGYPFLREGLLSGLLARSGGTLDVFPTLSPLQTILMAFDIDLTADLDIVDARTLAPGPEQRESHLIVTGVSNRILARKVASRLAELYPPTHGVVVASSAGEGGFRFSAVTLERLPEVDTGDEAAIYVGPRSIERPSGFSEFVRVISILRGPDGCPWDKAQDHLSLRRHMLEEAYEAVAAIESGDSAELADELGDVLLQVVLHAQIAAEEERFTIDDVVSRILEKIRRRHPHIFGEVTAETPEEVVANWDAIKRDEKAGAGLLSGMPRSLPALMLAQKISRRVVGVGFEWETIDDVWAKVHEEIDELKAAEPGSPEAAGEIGDLLFTVVNLARKQGIDAEEALRATCAKFTARWETMERSASAAGADIAELGIEGLEALWVHAKAEEIRARKDTGA